MYSDCERPLCTRAGIVCDILVMADTPGGSTTGEDISDMDCEREKSGLRLSNSLTSLALRDTFDTDLRNKFDNVAARVRLDSGEITSSSPSKSPLAAADEVDDGALLSSTD